MLPPDPEFLARANRARDKLVDQILDHPEVSLIDIGYDLENPGTPKRIVLRVHLRQAAAKQTLGLPEEIDGIPVHVMTGDYRLE
jgi:hypothetical protein